MLKLGPSWWVLVDFYSLRVGSSPRIGQVIHFLNTKLRSLKLAKRPPENRPSQKEIHLSTIWAFAVTFREGIIFQREPARPRPSSRSRTICSIKKFGELPSMFP